MPNKYIREAIVKSNRMVDLMLQKNYNITQQRNYGVSDPLMVRSPCGF